MAHQGLETTTLCLQALPGELRNRIYSLVTIHDELLPATVTVNARTFKAQPPALAATYRSIRGEVLSIYYGENTFVFYCSSVKKETKQAIEAWAKPLGRNTDKVRTIAASCADGIVAFKFNEKLDYICTCFLELEQEAVQHHEKRRNVLRYDAEICAVKVYRCWEKVARRPSVGFRTGVEECPTCKRLVVVRD